MAGDFNFPMDHRSDTTSIAPDREIKQLRKIKKKLYEHQLVDVWRVQHPSIKDYTYYSTVHGTYSRLDYIMVEHRALEEVIETTIGISSVSDHYPVSLKMNFQGESMGRGTWRINIDLLEDGETEKL